ncbi:MAG: discoidin domain-containing protein [Spirochaetota bacterium]
MKQKNFLFIRNLLIILFILSIFILSTQEIKLNKNVINAQSVPALNQGIWIEYVESNSYYDPNDPSKVYYAESLFDNLSNTSWVSQSKVTQPTIKIYFHIPMTFSSIYIKNGVGEEQTQDYIDNGRVKNIQIRTKYKNYNFTLSDTSQWQKISFENITVDYIEIVILDYYPGKRWFTIGMSEISFDFPPVFQINEITSKGQNLYSWMLQNISMNMPKDKFQYSKLLVDYVKNIISSIGFPANNDTSLREQAFPYFAFLSNRKFIPLSAGFPRNEEIKNLYRDSFGSPEMLRYQSIEAYSPSYFFSIYANALQPYVAMLAKSILLNTLQNYFQTNNETIFNDKYLNELLLHFLILGMDLRSNYYKQKYGNSIVSGLPISARVQFTFYRILRSLRSCPYLPIKFYETVMLEDPMELDSYISMLVEYIKNKNDFEIKYLETGEVSHITYNNDDFFVASIGNVDEFGQFAISMYLHNEDLIRYFKTIISKLPYDEQTIMELSKILIEANYYAKHPERQYY